jgi:hypothetical protein
MILKIIFFSFVHDNDFTLWIVYHKRGVGYIEVHVFFLNSRLVFEVELYPMKHCVSHVSNPSSSLRYNDECYSFEEICES